MKNLPIYLNKREAIIPGITWIFLAYVGTLLMQIFSNDTLIDILLVTLLILIFGILYYFAHYFLPSYIPLYFFLQGSIIFLSALILDVNCILILSLIPFIAGQIIGLVQKHKVVYFVLLILLLSVTVFLNVDSEILFYFAIGYIPISFVIIGYAANLFKLIKERDKATLLIMDLEEAYKKVERLTIEGERQRMARELHDSLAQGVTAIKMQSEAINVYLNQNNYERARQINQNSIEQAKTTLSDARSAIDDLRTAYEERGLENRLLNTINKLKMTVDAHIEFNYRNKSVLSELVEEHCNKIVVECLTNIIKYADANFIKVEVTDHEGKLYLVIADDGQGFIKEDLEKKGHYGLIGVQERVNILNGVITIDTDKNKGTIIKIVIPIS